MTDFSLVFDRMYAARRAPSLGAEVLLTVERSRFR
jgi:hypothetical protein